MKVVILNTFESSGGAAIAANRLMQALNKNGIPTNMLVLRSSQTHIHVTSIETSIHIKYLARFRFLWERFVIFFNNGFSRKNLFRVSIANTGFDLSGHPLVKEADIIHIHWINQGFLSLQVLKKLAGLGKPILWTMHDMWPITGICHHSRECDRFTNACGQCFFLQSKKDKDLSHTIFLAKRKAVFSNNNITLVGCSNWLSNKAKISGLSTKQKIASIPNPIDIHAFKVSNKLSSRKNIGLPENKKLLLFGAANLTDQRKGIDYLMDAIHELKQYSFDPELCLVVFGHAKKELMELIHIPVYSMGYMNQSEKIVALYNAVDVFVIPSLEENLPNTIMESMACGTPCVGFDVGGIPEIIDHKQNGYVAAYKNPTDLAEGIHWVLNQADYTVLSDNARKKVESTYSEDIVAKQYIELYKDRL